MNEHKQFIFIFSIGLGNLAWSGDQISALLERAANPAEREELRGWMERCKVGGFLDITNGFAVCVGMDPAANGKPPAYFADEGHGLTDKSKAAFLQHRRDLGPVERIEARLGDDGFTHEVTVIGENGNQLGLTGFAVGSGSGATGFAGFKWLLEMTGVKYDPDEVARVNLEKVAFVTYKSMRQTASGLILDVLGTPETVMLEAEVRVRQANGELLKLKYPQEGGIDFFTDADEMVDLVLQDMEIRGIEWTADPRISIRYKPDQRIEGQNAYNESLRTGQSKRIGWNYEPDKVHRPVAAD